MYVFLLSVMWSLCLCQIYVLLLFFTYLLTFILCILTWTIYSVGVRSIRPEVFLRKGALKISSKFKGKHPCWSVILMKLFCKGFVKGATEIINESYICVRHKNRQKHNEHFKAAFFTMNVHFVTSNQIPTWRKLS